MSESNIEKTGRPNHDEVLAAITSFNDPAIITNIFRDLGWSYSLEIKETLTLAKQNANLSIKFKAIRHLRELLREAAETSGYTARVSQTIPDARGGTTTFSAKRIANVLNPMKQIESTEIKELPNDQKETRTEPNRESNREQNTAETRETKRFTGECDSDSDSSTSIRDTGRAFPLGDVDSGGTESENRGETPRPVSRGGDDISSGNPCIQTRPPTCDRDLFPGISSAED